MIVSSCQFGFKKSTYVYFLVQARKIFTGAFFVASQLKNPGLKGRELQCDILRLRKQRKQSYFMLIMTIFCVYNLYLLCYNCAVSVIERLKEL